MSEDQSTEDRIDDAISRERRRAKRRERFAHARGVMDGICAQLRPGDVVLDCGANRGEVSHPLAETGATIYAFEPDPLAFAALAERLAGFANAHPVQAAVSSEAGRAILHRSTTFGDDPLAATVSSTLASGKRDADASGANDVEVEVMDLRAILAALAEGRIPDGLPAPATPPSRIALLKLDVEGEELTLLPALHEADLLAPVACTLVETHQRKFPDKRRAFLDMRRQIAGLYPQHKVNLDWV